jgi:L-aminopeptidase/D-esterase-like protein
VNTSPRWGSITDVPGIRVGQAQRIGDGWLTGVTVVLPPPGTTGSVEVGGGAPATHETDALAPSTLVPTVDAVTLTGGSAYGLAATAGVARWCEESGRGFPVGPPEDPGAIVVPIVPGAAVFDLGRGGDPSARPGPDLGFEAAAAASGDVPVRGVAGAGAGGLLAAGLLKGGVGTACVDLGDGLLVGAIAVVNAAGTPVDPVTGGLLGSTFVPAGRQRPPIPTEAERAALAAALERGTALPGRVRPRRNTTLAVVATNARLDTAAAHRTAAAAHDGLARATSPAHTLVDGDVVFSLATGEIPVEGLDLVGLQAAAADAVLLAVLDGVLAATTTVTAAGEVPAYGDLCPSVLG